MQDTVHRRWTNHVTGAATKVRRDASVAMELFRLAKVLGVPQRCIGYLGYSPTVGSRIYFVSSRALPCLMPGSYPCDSTFDEKHCPICDDRMVVPTVRSETFVECPRCGIDHCPRCSVVNEEEECPICQFSSSSCALCLAANEKDGSVARISGFIGGRGHKVIYPRICAQCVWSRCEQTDQWIEPSDHWLRLIYEMDMQDYESSTDLNHGTFPFTDVVRVIQAPFTLS